MEKKKTGVDLLLEIERSANLPIIMTVQDIMELRAASSISPADAEALLLRLEIMAQRPGYVQTMLQHQMGKNMPGLVT